MSLVISDFYRYLKSTIKLNALIAINRTPRALRESADFLMLLPKGESDLRAFSESITARLSLIAATMADTEKTPPEATKPITNSFRFESVLLFKLPVAASASTADSKTVGAN